MVPSRVMEYMYLDMIEHGQPGLHLSKKNGEGANAF